MLSEVLEMECVLLIFIQFNSKFVVICKNADIECRYIKAHTKEKPSNIECFAFLSEKYSN